MARLFITAMVLLLLFSCSRRHHPTRTPDVNMENPANKKTDTVVAKKVFKPTQKDLIPKVIVVNDNVAHKSVDGRFYYDLLGHRYWRNNKDGKYYLFNKSMYNNDAFKSPAK
ncbi:MAG: hypothetical protein ABJA57_12650 [Ginsengibacter sp.]